MHMLLTKTSELAIHVLLYLSMRPAGYLLNPKEVADELDESRTYISKVLRMLAQGGLVRSHRGVAGGFELERTPDEIRLIDIVEACQGTIPGNYCGRGTINDIRRTCGYHQAMHDLRDSTRAALSRWTLGMILKAPMPKMEIPNCMMRRMAVAQEVAG